MRRSKYLNAMLTVNAVALCLLVVMFATDRGVLARPAMASEQFGIPDAASQRLEMIRELRRISASMETLRRDLEKREFNVKVTSMPPVKVEGGESK
ncbi:MAG: hypothetical protein IT430_19010 [Phycisphaerales bacterium]|nr:hypothetical protein [Phycisphaerales bacterium]